MKKIFICLLFFIASVANSEPLVRKGKLIHIKKRETHIGFTLGYSQLADTVNLVSYGGKFRHALSDRFGLMLGVESFNSDTQDDNYKLASNTYLGLVYSPSGKMKFKEKFYEIKGKKRKYKKGNKIIIKQKRKVISKYVKMSDLKYEIHISNNNFYNQNSNQLGSTDVGVGAGAFYEGSLFKNKTYQIGIKYDHVDNDRIKANVFQVYFTLGLFP